jgi:hypothetical protein
MFTRYYCELWVNFLWTLWYISYLNCCRLEFVITGSAITWGVPSFQNAFQCFWWQQQGLLFFHTQVFLPHILMWWVMWIFFAISTITSFTHSAMQIIKSSSFVTKAHTYTIVNPKTGQKDDVCRNVSGFHRKLTCFLGDEAVLHGWKHYELEHQLKYNSFKNPLLSVSLTSSTNIDGVHFGWWNGMKY